MSGENVSELGSIKRRRRSVAPARVVKITERRTCPECNTLFDGSSDVCPVCALKSALEPTITRRLPSFVSSITRSEEENYMMLTLNLVSLDFLFKSMILSVNGKRLNPFDHRR